MKKRQNAYDKFRSKSNKKSFDLENLKKQEETYWIGATLPAMLVAGFFDGGISMIIAYGARQLYKHNTGK